MNNEILNKVEEIKNIIETSELYNKYKIIKKELENDQEIKQLINEIKILQKDKAHNINVNNELNKKNEILNTNPIYIEYINIVDEINNQYNIIEETLNKYFYDTFN